MNPAVRDFARHSGLRERGFCGSSSVGLTGNNLWIRLLGALVERVETVIIKPQKHKSPAFAGLSYESWRETRDSNPGNAINVRRFSRPLCKFNWAGALEAPGVPLLKESYRATSRILHGVRF